MSTHLHTYQCSLCKTVMVSVIKDRYRPCNGCRRWMKYLYSTRITTEAHRALAKRGTVFNPNPPERTPWNCARCGTEFCDSVPLYRVDGKVCRGCAQLHGEPEPLATPEQQAARKAESTAREREDQDRLEAAYAALEGVGRG